MCECMRVCVSVCVCVFTLFINPQRELSLSHTRLWVHRTKDTLASVESELTMLNTIDDLRDSHGAVPKPQPDPAARCVRMLLNNAYNRGCLVLHTLICILLMHSAVITLQHSAGSVHLGYTVLEAPLYSVHVIISQPCTKYVLLDLFYSTSLPLPYLSC